MLASSAEANTSAGAPSWIWVASVPDESNVNVTVDARVGLLEVVADVP